MNLEQEINDVEFEMQELKNNPDFGKDPFDCYDRKEADRIYWINFNYNSLFHKLDLLKRQLPKDKRIFPKKLREEILDRDNHFCKKCGSIDNLEIDHITPWRFGGKTNGDNAQVLCKSCNIKKLKEGN